MKELTCESVLMAQMAAGHGEKPEFSKEQVNAHIEGCANCQYQLEQMEGLDQMLAGQTLLEARVDLWPAMRKRITTRDVSAVGWRPFVLIGLLLVIYKLLEMLPERDPGLAFKLVPLVLVSLLFFLIKENPFRISSELVLER